MQRTIYLGNVDHSMIIASDMLSSTLTIYDNTDDAYSDCSAWQMP
jgi:hypothetical protein